MAVKERRDLLDAFRGRAINLADHVKGYHQGLIDKGRGVYANNPNAWAAWDRHMDFFSVDPWADNPFHNPPHFGTLPDGNEGIFYHFNEWCHVAFGGFRPKQGGEYKTIIGDAEVLHQKTVGAGRVTFRNDTDRDQEREHTFTEKVEETITESSRMAAKVATEFTQKFGYGSEALGVQGETEIKASIEAEAEKQTEWSQTTGSEDTGTWRGIVKANHVLVLERVRKIGHYRQVTTVTGQIDFDTYIFSDGDFHVRWTGTDEMRQCLSGVGRDKDEDGFINWAGLYNRNPIGETHRNANGTVGREHEDWFINMLCEPMKATVEIATEFDRAFDEEDRLHEDHI